MNYENVWKENPRPIGFVPTMGFLHEGHISLVRRAREECASVVASIFVNPTQFGPSEDLSRYPRDLPRDLSMLETAGVDISWTPLAEEMYPEGFNSWVNVEGITNGLEGEVRPGHFRGVTTVVTKLFHIVEPQKAYFGQKDAQQLAVIRKMTKDLNFPIEIIPCPTVREKDGLAMSSRNVYLSPEERQAATVIFRALGAARLEFQNGERDANKLRDTLKCYSVIRTSGSAPVCLLCRYGDIEGNRGSPGKSIIIHGSPCRKNKVD